MPERTAGLDIGGAHLKAALTNGEGRVTAALQLPCPLWQGLDRLEAALARAREEIAPASTVALTMTGGLGFLDPDTAPAQAAAVASANWLASASLAARRVGEGVFLDLGSTTLDVLVLAGGEVRAQALTDRERLAAGELVYTGLTRTPLMALARAVPFAGRWTPLMNEHFATTADLHRLLGRLDEAADQHPAADNGPKTIEGSARRLARMVGADLEDAGMAAWKALAAWLHHRQARLIEDALALQLSRGLVGDAAPLVGAGCGRFLLAELARRLGRPYRDFAELVAADGAARTWVATCAPAVAVALLARDHSWAPG